MPHLVLAFLGNIKIDHTISIDGFINAALTAVLTAIGYGLRVLYYSIKGFFTHIESMDGRIEDGAELIDLHSVLLKRGGLARGVELRKVAKSRRSTDKAATV